MSTHLLFDLVDCHKCRGTPKLGIEKWGKLYAFLVLEVHVGVREGQFFTHFAPGIVIISKQEKETTEACFYDSICLLIKKNN